MKIMKTINKIPAGLMIVPLFMGILINTFCPRVLQIGSFTTATFSNAGAASFMGVHWHHVKIQGYAPGFKKRRRTAPVQVFGGRGDRLDHQCHIWRQGTVWTDSIGIDQRYHKQ